MINLSVTVGVQGKDQVSATFKAAEGAASSLSSKITALSTSWMAFGQKALAAFVEPLKRAAESETVNARLANSLQIAGKYSDDAMKGIKAFADELGHAAGVGGGAIKTIVATNIALGMTEQQAEATAQAALGLAKYTGEDLNEANQKLISTLNGEARELKNIIPGVQSLTAAQLKHGGAIEFVGQKMKTFITQDANTTEGALKRLEQTWTKVTGILAGGFLSGFNIGGNFDQLDGVIQNLLAQVERFKPQLQDLGGRLMGGFSTVVKVVADNFGIMTKAVDVLLTAFDKMRNIFNILVAGFNAVVLSIAPVINAIVALGKAAAYLGTGQMDKIPAIWDDMTKANERYQMMAGKNASIIIDQTKALLGIGEAAAKTTATMDKATGGKAAGPTVADRHVGSVAHQMTDAEKEAQKALNIQLRDMRVAMELSTGAEVVAQHEMQLAKIKDLEEKANHDGLNIAMEDGKLRQTLAEDFSRKMGAAYLTGEQQAAEATGKTTDAIEAGYQMQVLAYRAMREKLESIGVEFDEDAANREARRKADNAKMGTTGSAAMDEKLTQANAMVTSMQGGVNSVAQTMVQTFGKGNLYAQFIASIFQLFNQLPAQFHQMVNSFQKELDQIPDNILRNIPYLVANLIQHLPQAIMNVVKIFTSFYPMLINMFSAVLETLPKALSQIFSAKFWDQMAGSAVMAFHDAFANFWNLIMTGKPLHSALAEQNQQVKNIKFGTDQPDAGDNQFKIKDADLRNARRAQTFQDTFSTAVQTGGEGFVDLLVKGFHQIIDQLDAWVKNIGNAIAGGLGTLADLFGKAGTALWKGLLTAASDLGSIGSGIWHSVIDTAKAEIASLTSLGSSIWKGLTGALTTGDFSGLGGAIWKGLTSAVTDSPFKTMGGKIWSAESDAMTGAPQTFKDMGSKIYEGLSKSMNDNAQLFRDMGGKMWEGLQKGLSSVGGGNNGGLLGKATGGILAGGGLVALAPQAQFAIRHFAGGGHVGGSGFGDTQLGALDPREFVLRPAAVSGIGLPAANHINQTGTLPAPAVNVHFHIASGAKVDRDAIKQFMPDLLAELRRVTRNGSLAINKAGVYG